MAGMRFVVRVVLLTGTLELLAPAGARAGTEIVACSSWCFAEARDSGGDDPNTTLVDEGDHWRVEVVDASGQPIGGPGGGETCAHPVGVDLCTIGIPGGQRTDHRLVTNHLRWQATCGGEITGGCPTSYGGYPLTTMVVYGTHITQQDDSAPSASLAGPLLAAGWHKARRAGRLIPQPTTPGSVRRR